MSGNQFPLFDSLSTLISDKNEYLTPTQIEYCVREIKTFDRNSYELLYGIIKSFEIHNNMNNNIPYEGKQLKTGVKFDFNNFPVKLQQMIYKFCEMRKDNMTNSDNRF